MYSEQKYTLILQALQHCMFPTPESGGHPLRGQALRHCGTALFGFRRVAPHGKRTPPMRAAAWRRDRFGAVPKCPKH